MAASTGDGTPSFMTADRIVWASSSSICASCNFDALTSVFLPMRRQHRFPARLEPRAEDQLEDNVVAGDPFLDAVRLQIGVVDLTGGFSNDRRGTLISRRDISQVLPRSIIQDGQCGARAAR